MMLTYKTLKEPYEAQIKIKSSVFIAKAYPIDSKNNVEELLASLRKKYFDASHICYAYRLHSEEIKYSDAGEPHGTAGIRIFNAIDHFGLFNTAVFVVRYFGGTKLGVGPLGKAYYDSALESLDKGEFVFVYAYLKISLSTSMESISVIYHILERYQNKILSIDYSTGFFMELLITPDQKSTFIEEVTSVLKGKCRIEVTENILYQ